MNITSQTLDLFGLSCVNIATSCARLSHLGLVVSISSIVGTFQKALERGRELTVRHPKQNASESSVPFWVKVRIGFACIKSKPIRFYRFSVGHWIQWVK